MPAEQSRQQQTQPRLQHVSLPVPAQQQEQIRAFYSGILGLIEKPVPASLKDAGLVWFHAGADSMELHFIPDPYLANPEEGRHFCLAVSNLEDYRQKLIAAGYNVWDATPIPYRPRLFCHDPFGNRVELTEILGDYLEAEDTH